MRRQFAIFATLLLALPASAALPGDGPGALSCEELPRLMGKYLQHHIEFRELSVELRERVAESYLRRLDPSRALLLEGEADGVRSALVNLFGDLANDRCDRLLSLQKLSLERIRQMEEFVRESVSADDYAIDHDAVLIVDPEERGFPKTREEQKALHLKLIHFQMANYVANGTELEEAKGKLIHRYELTRKRALEIETDDIYSQFLSAFANSLDPHSDYFSPDSYEDFAIHMSLELEGIGAVLSSRDGYTVIEEIVPGGAAELDGRLKPKDRILAVGQRDADLVDVVDMDLRDVVRKIRGKKGSRVWLSVLRQGPEVERFTAALVRDKINLARRAAKLRYENIETDGAAFKLAVIELPAFYGDKDPGKQHEANVDVRRLLEQIEKEGVDGLVLDLARNGGGLLDYAIEISGYFLKKGGIVAVGNQRRRTRVHPDPDEGIQYSGPLVVLTSRVTASAGEILAGAIKDYKRGVIVGDDHTFGKGSVQTVYPLPQGLGALKLTTDLFFRPGGASTQRAGVATDIELPSLTAVGDLGEEHQPYSLGARSIKPFLRAFAENGEATNALGDLGYQPLDPDTLQHLRARSAVRIGKDERFSEIEEARAKAADNDVVRIADLIDPKGETDDDAETPDAGDEQPIAEDEDTNTPQLDEALRILADLVAKKRLAGNP